MPVFEQAPKGKGTVLDLVWFGGNTFSPAAVTWLHEIQRGARLGGSPVDALVYPDGTVDQLTQRTKVHIVEVR